MADKFQPEATKMLRGLGLVTIANPDNEFNEGVRASGRADLASSASGQRQLDQNALQSILVRR